MFSLSMLSIWLFASLVFSIPIVLLFGADWAMFGVFAGWSVATISYYNTRCHLCGWSFSRAIFQRALFEWNYGQWRHLFRDNKLLHCSRCQADNSWTLPFRKPLQELPISDEWLDLVMPHNVPFPASPQLIRVLFARTLLFRADAQRQVGRMERARDNLARAKELAQKYKMKDPAVLQKLEFLEEKLGDGAD